MINNPKFILLLPVLALFSDAAFAESHFYGSVGYGSQSASREQLNTSSFIYSSTPYGAGRSVDLMLGMQFGSNENMFLELSSNRLLVDETISKSTQFVPVFCPQVIGVICPPFLRATSIKKFNSEARNIDLVFGWNFKPKEEWLLRPYLGARQLSLGINEYDVNRGMSSDIKFNNTGLIAGLKIQKNTGQWFYMGDLSLSGVNGTRTRIFSSDSVGAFLPAATKQEANVNQWQTKVAIGRKFQVSENAGVNVSLGYRIGSVNGFNESDYGAFLSGKKLQIKPKGFDVTIGWHF